MKKIICGLMTVMLIVAAFAAAHAETIMNGYVYDFVEHNNKAFEVFNKIENGETYIEDCRLYIWSTSWCLMDDLKGLTNKDIENYMIEFLKENGAKHVDVHVYSVGKDCVWVQINGLDDLTKIEGFGFEEEGPIYGCDIIAWRDNEHMH